MSPTVKSVSGAPCANPMAACTSSASAARATRSFMLQHPSNLPFAPPGRLTCIIREPQTQAACSTAQAAVRPCANPSTELARNVVVQRHTHQDDEQRDSHLLPERLGALRERAALQPLDELKG